MRAAAEAAVAVVLDRPRVLVVGEARLELELGGEGFGVLTQGEALPSEEEGVSSPLGAARRQQGRELRLSDEDADASALLSVGHDRRPQVFPRPRLLVMPSQGAMPNAAPTREHQFGTIAPIAVHGR